MDSMGLMIRIMIIMGITVEGWLWRRMMLWVEGGRYSLGVCMWMVGEWC